MRNLGLFNGKPAVLVILFRQPGANIISTVDRVRALLPALQASIPTDIDITVANDRTTTIRASLHDVERTLLIAITLVVLVVFLFLRNGRATSVPAVAVPISLLGTFGVMYLLGYSLDNLSLMALIIATGFVVDDAIVVLENITRHMEAGKSRMEAALLGAAEVGFTVLSMSLSLVAVFIPILMMGGIVGRLFREFSITLSVAVLVSLVISLTTTPMMCSRLIRLQDPSQQGRLFHFSERVFEGMLHGYGRALTWALSNRLLMVRHPRRHHRSQHLSIRRDSEGVLPRAGHRPAERRSSGRSGHFLPVDVAEAAAIHDAREIRPRGRYGGRLHRRRLAGRRADQQR